jgi:ubiquinone/menaquinone biosynthesis C-methylase UbiE
MDELDKIELRYKKREKNVPHDKYALTNPHILLKVQEIERKMIRLLRKNKMLPLSNKRILEVGCGTGQNLIEFIRMGANPKNIIGNDLLENRINSARQLLPQDLTLISGDASTLDYPNDSFDIILQSTVFTSILDDQLKIKIAERMWNLLKPGGVILWYDFIHANPYNKDVKAVSIKEIYSLFPNGGIKIKRLTLFPFIAEYVAKRFDFPYYILNIFPFMKMHILCTIRKK